MLLSPLAHPFHPCMGEDVNGIIYNDGIPTMQVQNQSEFLKGFSDDTMDDAFPPTAQDAAELEAVEIFVELMAALDILERKEEATRLVHAGLKKRWQARRELVGTPRNARHLIDRKIHGLHLSTDLVVYNNSSKVLEHRMRVREYMKADKPRSQKHNSKFVVKRPIQIPLKRCY